MDIGVGCFVFNAGVISCKVTHKKLLKNTIFMFLLGILRLSVVKIFQLDVNPLEYGYHWNFYFTLSFANAFFMLLNSKYNLIIGICILISYEIAYPLIVKDLIFEKNVDLNNDGLLMRTAKQLWEIQSKYVNNDESLIQIIKHLSFKIQDKNIVINKEIFIKENDKINSFISLISEIPDSHSNNIINIVISTFKNNVQMIFKQLIEMQNLFALTNKNIINIGIFLLNNIKRHFTDSSIFNSVNTFFKGFILSILTVLLAIISSNPLYCKTIEFLQLNMKHLIIQNKQGLISMIPTIGVYLVLNGIGKMILEKNIEKTIQNLKKLWLYNFIVFFITSLYSYPSRRVYNLSYNTWILFIEFSFLLLFAKLGKSNYFGTLTLYKFCSQYILHIFLFSNLLVLVFKLIFNLEAMNIFKGNLLILFYLFLNFIGLPLVLKQVN